MEMIEGKRAAMTIGWQILIGLILMVLLFLLGFSIRKGIVSILG